MVYAYDIRHQTKLHQIIVDDIKLSQTTKRQYLIALDSFCDEIGTSSSNWTTQNIDRFYKNLVRDGRSSVATTRQKSTISVQAANEIIFALKYAFSAVGKIYGENNFVGLSVYQLDKLTDITLREAEERIPSEALEEEAAKKLLNVCSNDKSLLGIRDSIIIVVGLETGMRRSSLAGMAWDRMKSHKTLQLIDVPIKGKGGEKRYNVPLSPTAVKALNFWKHKSKAVSGPIFRRILPNNSLSPDGLSDQAIYNLIVKRSSKAQIDRIHPHVLRGTFITWRQMANVSEKAIAAVTGHKGGSKNSDQKLIPSSYTDPLQVVSSVFAATPFWLIQFVENLPNS